MLLKPYQENDIYGKNFPTPPPEIINGEEVYQIETILKHRKRGRGYQYLIKWEGYPISEASWEPKSSFFQRQRFIGPLQKMTSDMKIFTSRQNSKQPKPCFRPTLPTILEEGEIRSHHVEVKLLKEMEQIVDEILNDYLCPPHVYPTLYTFLDKFL